jgi:hypothetical protein
VSRSFWQKMGLNQGVSDGRHKAIGTEAEADRDAGD